MMFNNLTNRLSRALCNIGKHGRITEDNIKETLREVRMALLEAEVALPVVRDFINCVKSKVVGCEINKSLTPGQKFIKIVRDELVIAMGKENRILNLSTQSPAVIIVTGLQGSGKTTTVGKLGNFLKKKYKKKILMVSTDVYRPAAIKQLKILSQKINADFFPSNEIQKPIDIVNKALKEAKLKFYDVLLIDTSGRLHINSEMMEEIKQICRATNPIEILFVIDAMTGQDAMNSAKIFNEVLPLTGIILTKVDSDARGGAALSVRYITGKPIKFLCVGEKMEDLEPFYPDRIASRILGMGDILSLIEDIESKVSYTHAEKLVKKLKKNNDFNLIDFLEQLHQIQNLGGITSLMNKLPFVSQIPDIVKVQINNKTLIHMEAIINSMTNKERANPDIIKGSRKRRIAKGCGMHLQEVNLLLKQFNVMRNTMKQMKKHKITRIIRNVKDIIPSKFPGVN